jgi:superfamily II DNA or RNA helicase
MHHVSSPTFTNIVDKSYARYKIGLSGTIERKDGKHVVFRDYFGNNVFKPPKENFMAPEIHIVNLGIRFMDGSNTPWALRVNDLVAKQEYRESIALIAAKYAAEGHNVLLVSDRVHFINTICDMLGDIAVAVTGDVSQEDREKLILSVGNGTKKVLGGTQAIFSEGISHNPLICLILATPIANEPLLTQLIGRVARYMPDKMQPVVVDINLKGKTAERQAYGRLGHYIKQGYTIRKF